MPGVAGVTFANWFGGIYQDPKNFVFSFPIDAARFFPLYPELRLPKDQLDALVRTRTGAVVGYELAQKYGWKIGDKVPLHSVIWTQANGSSDWTFDIVGIYEAPGNPNYGQQFFLQLQLFRRGAQFRQGHGRLVHCQGEGSDAGNAGGGRDRQALRQFTG